MQQQDLVTLTIDGREVSVPRGSTVLHAAQQLGIEIPSFCYSKKMDPLGACRMCLVQIEKVKGYPPSCATPVAPNMVVRTSNTDVVKTQQGILEFLLINHPLDCPICDKGGECPLQNLTFKYGPGKSRYTEEKRHFVKHLPIGPQIVLDRERCIVCQLCVRFMEDVALDPQITLMERGGKTEVNVFPDRPFDSIFAGNTIELCPVGALTSAKYRFRARPWDLEHTPGVCPTCAVGCNVSVDTRRGELLRLYARENLAVDDGWLCDYGRFATMDRQRAGERLANPMIRIDGQLVETSWEEALDAAARGLARSHGAGVAALGSPRATNEELYLLGRLTRSLLRSADVAVPGASPAPTSLIGGGSIESIESADVILLFDADPIARQHVLDLRIKKQVKRRGVPLAIVANEPTGLDDMAAAKCSFEAGNPLATVKALLDLLIGAGLPVCEPAEEHKGSGLLASLVGAVQEVVDATVEGVSKLTGAGAAAQAHAELARVADVLRAAKGAVVLYDERILVGQDVTALSEALAQLAVRVGGVAAKPLALAASANSRGAAEMGAHPHFLAGGMAPGDAEALARLGKAWGLQPTAARGKTAAEILESARAGELQALFLMGHDPIAEGAPEALAALEAVPFVVLQAARSGPAMGYADVVLPATNYAESPGTFTNLEGRVQRSGRAMRAPQEIREGWQVLSDLALVLDGRFDYLSAEEVTQEIARVTKLASWAELLQQALTPALAGGVR